jgi:hypothetical protein
MKLVIALALALAATQAHATPPYGEISNRIGIQNVNALGAFNGGNSLTGGDVSIDVDRPIPNGTPIGAASSNTTSNHRFLDSHSTSLLFFARSRTQMKFDIVSFVQSEPSDDAKSAACFMEEDYRKFREYVLDPCL